MPDDTQRSGKCSGFAEPEIARKSFPEARKPRVHMASPTMRNIAQWKRWFADNADLIIPVRSTTDIRRAKAEGKTGIILGFQNTSALEDQVGYIPLFKEL